MKRTIITSVALAAATVGSVAAISACGTTKTVTVTTPGPTVTQTVPGPTVTVSPPPPAAGSVIGTFSGTGNQVTKAFNVPSDGNFVVQWKYSGNIFGGGDDSGTNFIVADVDNDGDSLPNSIGVSGSGSTEVTGASGTDAFNVQATGNWTLTVISA
jgi:hypothetical protein